MYLAAASVAFSQLYRSSPGSGPGIARADRSSARSAAPVSGMNCHMPLAWPQRVGGPLAKASKLLSCIAR